MKFNLIDRIESIDDRQIIAIKYVTLAEEYLADHFPTFPVLPGVMMLEAATQAAGWLLHRRDNFACSMVVLKEARNVKYGNFVAPGHELKLQVDYLKPTPTGATFKVAGLTGASTAIAARIELVCFNLAQKNPELSDMDERLRQYNRRRWTLIAPATINKPVALDISGSAAQQ